MEAKPFASLTSGLLARKGQAKPAMRPQGFAGFGAPQEDLGWNDMGFDAPRAVAEPPPVVHFTPEPVAPPPSKQRRPKPKALPKGQKAAFTLRLDEERHLRLRLASALERRSSQRLVTAALDALLDGMPELDEMVAKAKRGQVGNGHA